MDRKPGIVVVEHDPYLGMLLLEVLTEQGYAVHLWTERQGAVELIRQMRPDLVILDLWLRRRGDGWQVYEALQADPATAQIPVVLCSEDTLLGGMDGTRPGTTTMIEKPFDLDDLLEVVATVLAADESRSVRQAQPAPRPAHLGRA